MQHIVIVEDEITLAQNYIDVLTSHGFNVTHYPDRRTAQEALSNDMPDLAIIDVGLANDADGGFELLEWLRPQAPALPILMLTHRDSDIDVVSGFRLGVDDYVSKSESLQVILARIKRLLSRTALTQQSDEQQIKVGDLTLDLDKRSVSWKEQNIDLPPNELAIVECLVKRPGHVKSKQQLMESTGRYVDDNTVTSYIKRIREHFKAVDPNFDKIKTEYSHGYRWKP